MERPQTAQRVLAYILQVGVVVQFFLAGLGVFRAKPHDADKLAASSAFDVHKVVGDALVLVSFALLVLAIVNRDRLRLSFLVFVLMLVQYGLARAGDSAPALGALHPVNGLLVLALAHFLSRRPRAAARGEPTAEAEPAAADSA
jgi:Family of unknown function (DUF6220)